MSVRYRLIASVLVVSLAIGTLGLTKCGGDDMSELVGSEHTIRVGELVDVLVAVSPTEPVAGLQFDMTWDPLILRLTGVTEGDFLKQGGLSSFFRQPTITEGFVDGVAGACIAGSVSTPGTFAILHFEALASGETDLVFSDVIVANAAAQPIAVNLTNGKVAVRVPWDVNLDGQVDVLDLIEVAQHWGANGPYDINLDHVVNVMELVLIAQQISPTA